MRRANRLKVLRVVRGTDHYRNIIRPQDYPVSPAIVNLLSRPTWSVKTLLPPSSSSSPATETTTNSNVKTTTTTTLASQNSPDEEITLSKLHHLLRLSALPLPKTTAESNRMLATLRSQIHFVRAIQSVDTSNVDPLITIRDETPEAIAEQTVTLDTIMPYLELEEKVGRNGTVRRRDIVRTPEEDASEKETWEVNVADLGVGSEKRRRGRWFYVRRESKGNGKGKVVEAETEAEGQGGRVKEHEHEHEHEQEHEKEINGNTPDKT